MKLSQVIAEISKLQLKVAAYDELCKVVEKYIEDDFEIPVEVDPGRVPVEVLREVLGELGMTRDTLLTRIEEVEDLEVSGVVVKDFSHL